MRTIPDKSLPTSGLKSPQFAILFAVFCVAAICPAAQSQAPIQTITQPSNPNRPSDQEIIQRIDAAVYQRFNAVTGYTVREQYSLFRNGESNPSAQETIQTVYNRSTGKQYTAVAQSGSSLMRSAVIDHILASEKEINLPANREAALITSHNYNLHPEPGVVEKNGRQCIVVDLHPRHKSPHLFTGKAFVDTSDFTVVHIEGVPSQSPSFFAGETKVSRDYIKIDGFSMATHAEARSHSFLFGDTLLTIDYSDYKIDQTPATNP
jgi:hypothetical protein